MENALAKAKTSAKSKVSDIQADTEQDQETIDALKSEKAALKQTISDQNKKIADLQQQLDNAYSAPANP